MLKHSRFGCLLALLTALMMWSCSEEVDLSRCRIVVCQGSPALCGHIAEVLAGDIEAVCGNKPEVLTLTAERSGEASRAGTVVLAVLGCDGGLLGADTALFAPLRGRWESYRVAKRGGRLLIVGSDARGLAYGALHVSELIGVSPWSWWADLPIKQRRELPYTDDGICEGGEPSVRYRGIFINDEDWGLRAWAGNNYEKDLGDIGPRTYDRVCELILRLGGNMLAPAMHSCTGAFYSHPESQRMADKWGIMITTSHCEPLLVNNAAHSEWDKGVDGEWNWLTNKERIVGKWDKRLSETAGYDNIYTIGMRGLHDEGMRGPTDPTARARTMEDVFAAQREILKKYKQRAPESVPQIFVPYKEALDTYDAGLTVPDDATLVWPDDNYGYMKRVSSAEEARRGGRAGVYYHLSYLGTPHDYLWICTTPPALMVHELRKAYYAGADRYWLLNVGDIKPMELATTQFFALARDIDSQTLANANRWQASWLASTFGAQHQEAYQQLLDDYYRLAWPRKPEFMGGEIEWDSEELSRPHDSEWSVADGTLDARLGECCSVAQRADSLERLLPEELRAAWFEMVGFGAQAQWWMNSKWLEAQRNHETGSEAAAAACRASSDSIDALMARYNTMLEGKWCGMMSQLPPGFCALYQKMPELVEAPTQAYSLPAGQRTKRLANKVPLTAGGLLGGATLVEGLGVDWRVVELGAPLTALEGDVASRPAFEVEIAPRAGSDSAWVCVSVVPFWPEARGGHNAVSVQIDGGESVVCDNPIVEWSLPWKEQVLANRKEHVVRLPLGSAVGGAHKLRIAGVDAGQMLQELSWE